MPAILVLCATTSLGAERHRSNIICRREFSAAHRDELVAKLRAITGWRDLDFQGDGALPPGTETPASGSQTARDLITRAAAGHNVLILEDASNRSDVAFARVLPGFWKREANAHPPVYVVLIDFADFDRLMGDTEALSAFDVGWALLHEVAHVVNDSDDPKEPGAAGECEKQINQMRRECNLPQRSDYFSKLFPHSEESAFITKLVRLAFDQEDPITSKHRRYWVIWDAALVGGLIAKLR